MDGSLWFLLGLVVMGVWDRRSSVQWWALFLWHKARGHHREARESE